MTGDFRTAEEEYQRQIRFYTDQLIKVQLKIAKLTLKETDITILMESAANKLQEISCRRCNKRINEIKRSGWVNHL